MRSVAACWWSGWWCPCTAFVSESRRLASVQMKKRVNECDRMGESTQSNNMPLFETRNRIDVINNHVRTGAVRPMHVSPTRFPVLLC